MIVLEAKSVVKHYPPDSWDLLEGAGVNDDGYSAGTTKYGIRFAVIVSWGMGWDHVSVSTPRRCPSWNEMDEVKQEFFGLHTCVMQLHVPVAEHVNFHPHCLHLWRPQMLVIPQPPALMVGP